MNPNIRSQLLRVSVASVDDSGPQQLVKVTGLAGQTIGEAVRSQHFGFTSNPPKGAEGLILALGGSLDRAHALGLEHPEKRPTGLASGAVTLYDSNGNKWEFNGQGAKLTDLAGNIVATAPSASPPKIYIKPHDNSTIVFLGGDGVTGTYDFVLTPSGPSINVKARIG